MPLDELNEKTKAVLNQIEPYERLILDKDTKFIRLRIFNILEQYFKPFFPKTAREEMLLHITWFMQEMMKLGDKEYLIDYEWNNNRNEDAPDFDDFKWWRMVDRKVKKLYPECVFSPKSLQHLRDDFDNQTVEMIMRYWEEHPDEHHEFMETFDNEDLNHLKDYPELKKRHEAIKKKW